MFYNHISLSQETGYLFVSESLKITTVERVPNLLNFLHLVPNALTEHREITKWVLFQGKRIKRNSVIIILEVTDTEFHIQSSLVYFKYP